jgi:hypothetical protein
MMCSYYALIRKFIYIYIALKVYNLTINIRAMFVLIASHILNLIVVILLVIYCNTIDI